jgi:hypothetical protein
MATKLTPAQQKALLLAQQFVIVRFGGGWGTQFAAVLGHAADGRVRLAKWRKQGRQWTRPALFPASSILREAGSEDVRQYHADLSAFVRQAKV